MFPRMNGVIPKDGKIILFRIHKKYYECGELKDFPLYSARFNKEVKVKPFPSTTPTPGTIKAFIDLL
ncbi:hypothetical protein NQ317_003571 [Molorchus minor]|uniref:Uncharacterized protein n=1 Tax=Molorchus minor TaxID=1323400 RepID=A0ABQ9JCX5_9CUCU|nr:hypothetical protein NQ317_003571 [Molorchus minor]